MISPGEAGWRVETLQRGVRHGEREQGGGRGACQGDQQALGRLPADRRGERGGSEHLPAAAACLLPPTILLLPLQSLQPQPASHPEVRHAAGPGGAAHDRVPAPHGGEHRPGFLPRPGLGLLPVLDWAPALLPPPARGPHHVPALPLPHPHRPHQLRRRLRFLLFLLSLPGALMAVVKLLLVKNLPLKDKHGQFQSV